VCLSGEPAHFDGILTDCSKVKSCRGPVEDWEAAAVEKIIKPHRHVRRALNLHI
jgi:hypothetical protein